MTTGVAIIGAGYISYLHVLGARVAGGLAVKAVASRSSEQAEHRGRIFAADAYSFDQIGAMLARDDIAIAVVASPNALHFSHAMAAIEHGKHAVIEKPLVLTLEEADRLANAAQAKGLDIGYAENLVFAPIVVAAREIVAGGALGRIVSAHCDFKHGGPATTGWFRSAELAGGGAHIDLGCHALEMLLYLCGRPCVTHVAECRMEIDPKSGLDLTARAVHACDGGLTLTTDSSWCEPNGGIAAVLEGEQGRLRILFNTQELMLEPHDKPAQTIDFPHRRGFSIASTVARQGYSGQLAEFAKSFATGASPREGIAEGTTVLRLLLAAYASAATGAASDMNAVPGDVSPIGLWRRCRLAEEAE